MESRKESMWLITNEYFDYWKNWLITLCYGVLNTKDLIYETVFKINWI